MQGLTDPPMAHIEVDLYLHVRVLIAIILGLSVTRLLGGIAQFMRQSDHRRLSWIQPSPRALTSSPTGARAKRGRSLSMSSAGLSSPSFQLWVLTFTPNPAIV